MGGAGSLQVTSDCPASFACSSWASILSVPGMSVMLQPSGAGTVWAAGGCSSKVSTSRSVGGLVVDAVDCCVDRSVAGEVVSESAVPQAAMSTLVTARATETTAKRLGFITLPEPRGVASVWTPTCNHWFPTELQPPRPMLCIFPTPSLHHLSGRGESAASHPVHAGSGSCQHMHDWLMAPIGAGKYPERSGWAGPSRPSCPESCLWARSVDLLAVSASSGPLTRTLRPSFYASSHPMAGRGILRTRRCYFFLTKMAFGPSSRSMVRMSPTTL